DGPPAVDLAVLVLIDADLGAAGVEPAVGVGLAVQVGVHLAVDLDAVVVVGPDVDLAVAVAVEEAAEQLAVGVLEHPAAALAGDLALVQVYLAVGLVL